MELTIDSSNDYFQNRNQCDIEKKTLDKMEYFSNVLNDFKFYGFDISSLESQINSLIEFYTNRIKQFNQVLYEVEKIPKTLLYVFYSIINVKYTSIVV